MEDFIRRLEGSALPLPPKQVHSFSFFLFLDADPISNTRKKKSISDVQIVENQSYLSIPHVLTKSGMGWEMRNLLLNEFKSIM